MQGFEIVQQGGTEDIVQEHGACAHIYFPHTGDLCAPPQPINNQFAAASLQESQPLLTRDDVFWSKRTRIIRAGKLASWAIIGLLLGTTCVFFLVQLAQNWAPDAFGHSQGLTSAQAAEIQDSVPDGVTLDIPPASGQPIRKQNHNHSQGSNFSLDPRVNYSSFLKPVYHLTPEKGWMNDPNGMFQLPSSDGQTPGPVHVFYQYNPKAPVWGPPWWGHVISWDLVHWTRLTPALKPDTWYDRDGVFSGSATVLPDGVPIMLYTAVMNFSQLGFYYQTQAWAAPVNISDPLLLEWTKEPLQGMNIPPGGTHAQFRDPVTAWQVPISAVAGLMSSLNLSLVNKTVPVGDGDHGLSGNTGDGLWMTAVGVLDDCVGAAALYISEPDADLRQWTYAGTLYSQLGQNATAYSSCLPAEGLRDTSVEVPSGARGFGGHCDQFGQQCRMWECPDFFSLDSGIQVFKYSDQSRSRHPFAADSYTLGDLQLLNYTRALAQDGQDAFVAVVDDKEYGIRPLDYGIVYASKSFRLVDGRRVWLGWVYEDSLGCSEVCGDGTPFIRDTQLWQGAQTLLREITYLNDTRTLRFWPVAETSGLRRTPVLVDTETNLNTSAASQSTLVNVSLLPELAPGSHDSFDVGQSGPVSITHGRQLEVHLSFSLLLNPAASGSNINGTWPLKLGLRVLTGNGTYTDVILTGTSTSGTSPVQADDEQQQRVALLTALSVQVDRTAAGGITSSEPQQGEVPLPAEGLPAQHVNLTVFVDRSVWEVYALDGRAVITTRVYPLPWATTDADGNEMVDDSQLGSWGYEVLAEWEAGAVTVHATVYDMDSCWSHADG